LHVGRAFDASGDVGREDAKKKGKKKEKKKKESLPPVPTGQKLDLASARSLPLCRRDSGGSPAAKGPWGGKKKKGKKRERAVQHPGLHSFSFPRSAHVPAWTWTGEEKKKGEKKKKYLAEKGQVVPAEITNRLLEIATKTVGGTPLLVKQKRKGEGSQEDGEKKGYARALDHLLCHWHPHQIITPNGKEKEGKKDPRHSVLYDFLSEAKPEKEGGGKEKKGKLVARTGDSQRTRRSLAQPTSA